MTLDTTLRRNPDVRFRRVKDEFVVIRQQTAEVLVLNEWAGRVLELLDGTRTLREVSGVLLTEFDAPASEVEGDVIRFGVEIVESGLGAVMEPAR